MSEPKWPYLDLDSNLIEARQMGLPATLFPFLVDNGNYYCFDLATSGPEYGIVFWSHDGLLVEERWPSFLLWVRDCWIAESAE